jgi:hypothetical protein
MLKGRGSYGIHSQRCTGNVPFVTTLTGKPIRTCFPVSDKAVGKDTGLTNRVERFNNTLRQRVSRLVRKTLSFSKKLESHMGAIIDFTNHYNISLHL